MELIAIAEAVIIISLIIERIFVHRVMRNLTRTANEQAAKLSGIIQKDAPHKP